MRWEQLFADLEAQFDDLAEADGLAEAADRQRIEFGAIDLVARLMGALHTPIRVRTAVGIALTGVLRRVGPDWVLMSEAPGREVLVPLAAIGLVEGLGPRTGMPLTGVAARLLLRSALREIARDRSPVALTVLGGAGGSPGGEVTGTIDRVGADFIEMATGPAWEPRRAGSVRQTVAVPAHAVVFVRAQPLG